MVREYQKSIEANENVLEIQERPNFFFLPWNQ